MMYLLPLCPLGDTDLNTIHHPVYFHMPNLLFDGKHQDWLDVPASLIPAKLCRVPLVSSDDDQPFHACLVTIV
jgi:hypothetical protein